MKSIRKFTYAALLTLGALNLAPSLAAQEPARGAFTLTHDVHWQKNIVPAGDYSFSLESEGPAQLLTLRRTSGGGGAAYMMLVSDVDEAKSSGIGKIELVSRPGGSFVSSMELPEYGMTLRFAVPAEPREMAQAGVSSAATSAH